MSACLLSFGPIVTTAEQYWTSETFSYFWHNSTMTQVLLYLPGVFENHPQKGAVERPLWSILMELELYVVTALLFLLGILRRRVVFNALFLFLITLYFLNPQLEMPWVLPWDSPWQRSLVLLYFTGTFYYLNADKILNPFILPRAAVLCRLIARRAGAEIRHRLQSIAALSRHDGGVRTWLPVVQSSRRLFLRHLSLWLAGRPDVYLVNPTLSALENAAWSIAITLLLAIASWHLIEKRALSLKSRSADCTAHVRVGWESSERPQPPRLIQG